MSGLVACSPRSQLKITLPNRVRPRPVKVVQCPPHGSCIKGEDLENALQNWIDLDAHATELEELGCFEK